MNEAVRAAVLHTLRDASGECLQILRDGNVDVKDAIATMTSAFVELAVLNVLAGETLAEPGDDVRAMFLERCTTTFDEFKAHKEKQKQ